MGLIDKPEYFIHSRPWINHGRAFTFGTLIDKLILLGTPSYQGGYDETD